MSVPVAHLPTPLAVLVLAWDEATPAVRALVDATTASTPAVDSVLVMVPQAEAPDLLSAEEYLPLAPPEPLAPTYLPAAVTSSLPPEAAPPLAETPPPAPPTTTLLRAEVLEEDAEPATDELLLPAPPPAPAATPTLAWSAVRVLRLAGLSLPQLAQLARRPLPAPTWLGPATPPAAPYLGAELPAALAIRPPEPVPPAPVEPTSQLALLLDEVAEEPTAKAPAAPAPALLPSEEPAATPASLARQENQPAAPEINLSPTAAAELELFELANRDLATPEMAEPAPQPAGWPEALASLRQPAKEPLAAATPAPTPPAEPISTDEPVAVPYAALRPPSWHFPAPNLNFQVIQYARFAVPVALADSTFEVLYAPAWPTWLAAQELRQRTGKPLVLHVAALAALATDSIETATGWIAELQRQALRRADLVLAETPALAQRLHHELGLAAGTVQVIAAADAAAIAQALHEARPRPVAGGA